MDYVHFVAHLQLANIYQALGDLEAAKAAADAVSKQAG